MSLDPSFDTDTLAKALGIPSSKHMLHRHLYEEMKSLAVHHRWIRKLLLHTFPMLFNSLSRIGSTMLRYIITGGFVAFFSMDSM